MCVCELYELSFTFSSKALSRLKKITAGDVAAEAKEDIGWQMILDNALNWSKWNEVLELIEEFVRPVLLPTQAPEVSNSKVSN